MLRSNMWSSIGTYRNGLEKIKPKARNWKHDFQLIIFRLSHPPDV